MDSVMNADRRSQTTTVRKLNKFIEPTWSPIKDHPKAQYYASHNQTLHKSSTCLSLEKGHRHWGMSSCSIYSIWYIHVCMQHSLLETTALHHWHSLQLGLRLH